MKKIICHITDCSIVTTVVSNFFYVFRMARKVKKPDINLVYKVSAGYLGNAF